MAWYQGYIEKLVYFDDANKIMEIGSGDFSCPCKMAEKFLNKKIYALDYTISNNSIPFVQSQLKNFYILKADACDMEFIQDKYFDFIYSVAVCEHIYDLEKHLSDVWRILKSGGVYFFWAAPLWSCSMGHHYLHNQKHPFPLYSHLYMSKDEFQTFISDKMENYEFVTERIYDRPDLSRLYYKEYIDLLNKSPFKVIKLEHEIDQNFNLDSANHAIKLNDKLNIDEMRIKGIKVVLQK